MLLLLYELREQGYEKKYFLGKDYGHSIEEISISMVCMESFLEVEEPYLHGTLIFCRFKFDHGEFTRVCHKEKKRIVGKQLNDGLRRILIKMKLPADFKLAEFLKDNKRFLRQHGWLD